jgi:glucosamine-6-phosphate deaminase
MEVIVKTNAEDVSVEAAAIFRRQLREKPDSVLGLATGSTPVGLYDRLVTMARTGEIDLSRATTFNLDEYVGLPASHPQSYAAFMKRHLFDRVSVAGWHIPDGMADDIPRLCADYEEAILEAGGIDLQLLGLGGDGHIGFNEPGSSLGSRTRLKTLTARTVADNARYFASPGEVPRHVVTMGVGTICDARHCLVLAFGENKATAVAAMVEGPVTAMVPASALQLHPVCTLVVDEAAASRLQRRDYYRWVYENKPAWQRA